MEQPVTRHGVGVGHGASGGRHQIVHVAQLVQQVEPVEHHQPLTLAEALRHPRIPHPVGGVEPRVGISTAHEGGDVGGDAPVVGQLERAEQLDK